MVSGMISSLPLGNLTPVPPSWEVQVQGSQTRGLEAGGGEVVSGECYPCKPLERWAFFPLWSSTVLFGPLGESRDQGEGK